MNNTFTPLKSGRPLSRHTRNIIGLVVGESMVLKMSYDAVAKRIWYIRRMPEYADRAYALARGKIKDGSQLRNVVQVKRVK